MDFRSDIIISFEIGEFETNNEMKESHDNRDYNVAIALDAVPFDNMININVVNKFGSQIYGAIRRHNRNQSPKMFFVKMKIIEDQINPKRSPTNKVHINSKNQKPIPRCPNFIPQSIIQNKPKKKGNCKLYRKGYFKKNNCPFFKPHFNSLRLEVHESL